MEPYKILMLDDNEELQETMRMSFELMEYNHKSLEMISAHNTHEGIEAMLRHPDIAMCIVDLNLEKEEAGLEFIERVREELENMNVSIFIMTAHQNLLWKYAYNAYEICGLLPKGYFDLTTFQNSIYEGLKRYDEKMTREQVTELYMRLTKMLAMTFNILKESGMEGQYEFLEDAIHSIITQIEEKQEDVTTNELMDLYEKLLNIFDVIDFTPQEPPEPHLRLIYTAKTSDSISS